MISNTWESMSSYLLPCQISEELFESSIVFTSDKNFRQSSIGILCLVPDAIETTFARPHLGLGGFIVKSKLSLSKDLLDIFSAEKKF